MITRWSIAHERLLQALKVRTHHRKETRLPPPSRSPIPEEWKAGRPLRIHGNQYPSIGAARKALGIHPRRIYDLIETGEASFL